MKSNSLFNSTFYYCFLHVILFFYIYSIQFKAIPFGLGTRVLMGFIGFVMFLVEITTSKKDLAFSKQFFRIYLALFFISFFSFFSLLYNGTTDVDFLFKYQFSIITIIFASNFITKLIFLKQTPINKVPLIMTLFINVVLIQIVISLLMFTYSPIRDFLNGIQVVSDRELELFEETLEFRLVGFGSKFFGSGIINGFALIVIGSVIKFKNNAKLNVLKYSFSFLFIFVCGMMMARTTIVGGLLGLGIVFWPSKRISFNQIKIKIKFLAYLILIPVVLVFFIFYFFPNAKNSLEGVFNFGFEMFINYFESDSLESASTNQMKEMYIWPTSLKTYLIGDGLFSDAITGGYYMGTDIGILRLIYYFGIFGLLAYIYLQFQIAYGAYLRNYRYRKMFLIIFLYCLVLNYKGFTDLVFLNILFFINNTYYEKRINE
jgi:hypothetical protein